MLVFFMNFKCLEFRGTIQHYWHHGMGRTQTYDGRVRTLSFQSFTDHTTVTAIYASLITTRFILVWLYSPWEGHSCLWNSLSARLVPFQKMGVPYHPNTKTWNFQLASSYRPIAHTRCVCKIDGQYVK